MRRASITAWCWVAVALAAAAIVAEEPANDAIRQFADAWSDSDWGPKNNPRRPGYMRPLDDAGWKSRMIALQSLVRLGPEASAALQQSLRDGAAPERILAAQTLGYVQAEDARATLAHAAEHDDDAAVRLYAVDSLAMLGERTHDDLFRRLSQNEKNRDVKMHLAYALERAGEPVAPAVIDSLKSWDNQQIDTARLGRPAPDFALTAISGETVRLSDFRGKRAVVLVFVYGDT